MGKKQILIVGWEPGSGSTLGPVIKRLNKPLYDCKVICSHRSFQTFEPFTTDLESIEDSLNSCEAEVKINYMHQNRNFDTVLSTLLGDYDTSLDRTSLRVSVKKGIRHIAIIDSWTCLDERIDNNGEEFINIPSIIGVPDEFTRDEYINMGIPLDRISVTGHPFFDEIIVRESAPINKKKKLILLLQPLEWLNSHFGANYGYVESDFVGVFFSALQMLRMKKSSIEITIREHPRRKSNYSIPDCYNDYVSFSSEGDGWKDILGSDVVIGMSSTLLVYSFLARIPTIVVQPELTGKDPCALSKFGILDNCGDVDKLATELEKAIEAKAYQMDSLSQSARKKFKMDGNCSQRVIDLL